MRRIWLVLLTSALILSPKPAHAKTWKVDYSKSRLGFVGQQGTANFNGSFQKFTTTIDFDPDNPTVGTIAVSVDTSSASTGEHDRDSWLPQSDWFNIAEYPVAEFLSTSIRKLDDGGYAADGMLKIKGISKFISIKFNLRPEADEIRAIGTTHLTRTDYNVGIGEWAGEDYVKLGVDVVIEIVAKPEN